MPPWSVLEPLLYYTVLPPFGVALVVTAAVAWIGGEKQAPAAAALGLALGGFLGCWLSNVFPLVQGDSFNQLPWAALGILCIGRLARLCDLHVQHIDGCILRAAASLGTAWWLVPDRTYEPLPWLAPVFAAVLFIEWVTLDYSAAALPGPTVPLALALTFLIAGIVVLQASSKKCMDVSLVLAFGLIGIAMVSRWRHLDVGGVAPIAAVMLPGLLLIAHQTTSIEDLPQAPFWLVAVAPLLLVPTLLLWRWNGIRMGLLRLALVLFPLAIAFYLVGPPDVNMLEPPHDEVEETG